MAGEATPTDGRFRRGVYVMLVVLGILAASGPIAVRQARQDSAGARHEAAAARAEAAASRAQVATLIAGQSAAAERDRLAEEERAALLHRSRELEQLLTRLLADSSDPTVRGAFQQYQRRGATPAPTSAPSPRPSPRPHPAPSSTPQPSPSQSCVRTPVLSVCR